MSTNNGKKPPTLYALDLRVVLDTDTGSVAFQSGIVGPQPPNPYVTMMLLATKHHLMDQALLVMSGMGSSDIMLRDAAWKLARPSVERSNEEYAAELLAGGDRMCLIVQGSTKLEGRDEPV